MNPAQLAMMVLLGRLANGVPRDSPAAQASMVLLVVQENLVLLVTRDGWGRLESKDLKVSVVCKVQPVRVGTMAPLAFREVEVL